MTFPFILWFYVHLQALRKRRAFQRSESRKYCQYLRYLQYKKNCFWIMGLNWNVVRFYPLSLTVVALFSQIFCLLPIADNSCCIASSGHILNKHLVSQIEGPVLDTLGPCLLFAYQSFSSVLPREVFSIMLRINMLWSWFAQSTVWRKHLP